MRTPRFLNSDRGTVGQLDVRRQTANEIDLDAHDAQLEVLRTGFSELKEDVRWVKRLLVGVLASTTGAALLLATQRFTG